jgi:uncharacterized membrane protein
MAVLFGILAMLGWGLWSVLAKLATRSLPPALAMVISYATGALIALGYVSSQRGGFALPTEGVLLAAAAGIFAGIGGVAFYMGLDAGRASIVTTVSALYFVVAAVFGIVILGESLDLADLGGIGFAVVAVVLLAK